MTISSANLVAPDEHHVLFDLKENLSTASPSGMTSPNRGLAAHEHPSIKEDSTPSTGRHSAAAEVLQLRAELHRERQAAAAAKADSLRLIENVCAQRDEARERALGLQAALDAHLRAEAERLAATGPATYSVPPARIASPPGIAMPHPAPEGALHSSEDEAALLAAIAQPLGFHRGRPVAAMLIFRCCVQWSTLQHDPSSLVKRIVATVNFHAEAAAPPPAGTSEHLCYWLANVSALLLLLHQHTHQATPQPLHLSLLSSAYSRLGMLGRPRPAGADESVHGGGAVPPRQSASMRPAHTLKQALGNCIDSLGTALRDDAKRALQEPLPLCIQPGSDRNTSLRSGEAAAQPAAVARGAWGSLIKVLQGLHEQLAANEVPRFLRRKLFLQLFSFINVQLFNQLLLRRECCSFTNGEYVKQGLAQVEEWLLGKGAEVAGESWDELKYIRQAVNFLVLHAKQKKTLDDIQQNLCSALSVQQLYRISTMYWDDKFGTETVSPEVLLQLRGVMQRQPGSESHSFLLDDDRSNPFQAAEVQPSLTDKELYGEMPVPEPLQGNKAFDFLQRDLKLSSLAAQPAQ